MGVAVVPTGLKAVGRAGWRAAWAPRLTRGPAAAAALLPFSCAASIGGLPLGHSRPMFAPPPLLRAPAKIHAWNPPPVSGALPPPLGVSNSDSQPAVRPSDYSEYYGKITTTRKYEDRLATLEAVRQAGISVCAGGIIGLGEGEMDRVGLLHQVWPLRPGRAVGRSCCCCCSCCVSMPAVDVLGYHPPAGVVCVAATCLLARPAAASWQHLEARTCERRWKVHDPLSGH